MQYRVPNATLPGPPTCQHRALERRAKDKKDACLPWFGCITLVQQCAQCCAHAPSLGTPAGRHTNALSQAKQMPFSSLSSVQSSQCLHTGQDRNKGPAHPAAHLHCRRRLAPLPVHLVARHDALQQPRAAAHLPAQLLHGAGGAGHNVLDVGDVPARCRQDAMRTYNRNVKSARGCGLLQVL